MVEFRLTEEQELVRKTMHEFAENEIRPVAMEYDKKAEIPWDVMEKAHDVGIDTFDLPEEWGGGGNDSVLTSALVAEELTWGCAGVWTSLQGPALAGLPIDIMGNDEQREKYLSPFCGDEPKLGAMAITEPEAGSDVRSISTTAELEGDEWVLNGTKAFITNGGVADLHVVFATIDRSMGYGGIRGFIVPTGIGGEETDGIEMGTVYDKMGIRASHTAEVILRDCRIPEENVLGSEKTGFYGAMRMLDSSRVVVAAGAVGVARAAYEYALDYSKQREAFGKPIADFQAIRFMLAEMSTQIDAARLLVWRAGWKADGGEHITRDASMAKMYASDMSVDVTNKALQILGGHGYMADHPVEKWVRDARVFPIWEGTSEIQKLVVSREEIGAT